MPIESWRGFCFTVYYVPDSEGSGNVVTHVAKAGNVRSSAILAWEDARALKSEREQRLKEMGVKASTIQPGICTPDHLP